MVSQIGFPVHLSKMSSACIARSGGGGLKRRHSDGSVTSPAQCLLWTDSMLYFPALLIRGRLRSLLKANSCDSMAGIPLSTSGVKEYFKVSGQSALDS